MNDKVIVTSMVSGVIGLNHPEYRLVKTWPKKGTKLPIEKEALRQAIYEPGVEYMFKNGMLYMDDMDFKIELGLEEEGTKIPTTVVPMDEKYLERVFKRMPVIEMKTVIKSMNGISIISVDFCTATVVINPVIPRIIKTFKIFEPTTLPTAIAATPLRAPVIETAASGADVPIATIVRPTTSCGIPNFTAIPAAPSTNQSAPFTSIVKPTTNKTT